MDINELLPVCEIGLQERAVSERLTLVDRRLRRMGLETVWNVAESSRRIKILTQPAT